MSRKRMRIMILRVESSVKGALFRVKHSAQSAFIPVILLLTLILFLYILSRGISFFIHVVSKATGFLGVKALSFVLAKVGCPATLSFVIGCAFRALVTTEASPSLAHWMLPGPSHQPHVAEEDYPRDHPVAHRSAPPEGLGVKKPLMEDEQRYGELEDRLSRHFLLNPDQIKTIAYDDLVEKQLLIERKMEMALLNDEYSRDRILANRYEIRECLFYKEGVPLKEKTLDLYLKQIKSHPFESTPYRKIQKEIKDFNLYFSK